MAMLRGLSPMLKPAVGMVARPVEGSKEIEKRRATGEVPPCSWFAKIKMPCRLGSATAPTNDALRERVWLETEARDGVAASTLKVSRVKDEGAGGWGTATFNR